jgi:hypothetical protein
MPESSTTETEALDFLDKLAQFHATLSPTQQVMLDELTATSLQAPEVEGFALPGTTQPLPILRQTLLGQATDTSLSYYRYYANVAKLL